MGGARAFRLSEATIGNRGLTVNSLLVNASAVACRSLLACVFSGPAADFGAQFPRTRAPMACHLSALGIGGAGAC